MVVCSDNWRHSIFDDFTVLLIMKKIVSIVLLFIVQITYAQCAMCKAVVESGDAEIAESVNSGIIYLMAFPYILVAAGAFFLYKNYKKLKL